MSTKNLGRTVIEGGRSGYSRRARRHSNAVHRAREKETARGLLTRVEPDEVVFTPRETVRRDFADKLSPAARWLERQIGRPWSRVRSELFERFDSRTTAGRHILFCHVLPAVRDGWGLRRIELRVDRHGFLRRVPSRKRAPIAAYDWHYWHRSIPHDVEAWLAGRRVGQRGEIYYWFTRTPFGQFRQHLRLDEEDVEFWLRLPAWLRERLDVFAEPESGVR